jgi:SpoVK/Ycf46/Vps4 family AAA+-type ATPase
MFMELPKTIFSKMIQFLQSILQNEKIISENDQHQSLNDDKKPNASSAKQTRSNAQKIQKENFTEASFTSKKEPPIPESNGGCAHTNSSESNKLKDLIGHLTELPNQFNEKNSPPPKKNFNSMSALFTIDKDLILNTETKNHLEEAIAKIKWHRKIYDEWDFASVDPLGKSSILNFYGPPGTGKTMAAEAIAGTLGVEIIKISIAELESKYMGETAQNIQASFLQATQSGSLLFFDEADTLLGKRLASVTQGIDNEVNAMRSTLLIELERFDGLVIFATNFAKNYDEAFRSRISHHIPFLLPELETRKGLWARMLLPTIPITGERTALIDQCAENTEGFSGREIRTCMRLALPKALIEAETNTQEPFLTIAHIEQAISQIRAANIQVANSTPTSSARELDVAKSLLGIHSQKKGN